MVESVIVIRTQLFGPQSGKIPELTLSEHLFQWARGSWHAVPSSRRILYL
eukprot:COSAG05_NODE_2755_length_2681_cov_3.287410_3_plen_50_part_00